MTIRDDSIMVQPPPRSWYHSEMAQAFWPKLPVILEHEHYHGSKGRGAWKPELSLKSVEEYHASFMSIHVWPRDILGENRDIIDKINLRMGYRLRPVEVTWPKTAAVAPPRGAIHGELKNFTVRWSWINSGVAPCYPGGFPALTLKDHTSGIVSVLTDESLNMRDLKVGKPGKAPVTTHQSEFIIGLIGPITRPGTYDLYISVGRRDGTPTIALPLKDGDGQRRYRLGSITLEDHGTANN